MKTRVLGLSAVATLGALFTLAPSTAHAAGTALDVQGARGTGMASTTTAWIDDASAIYYNPAGIAQGQKFMAEAGLNVIAPSFKYKPSGQSTEGVVTPFQVYATAGLTDNLSVGIGIFTPFGLTVKWPDGWAGRSLITESSLRTFYINPTVAYHFGPLRIGAGLQVVRATLELQRDINFGDSYGHADLGAGTWASSANIGAQLELIKQYLNVGASFRGGVKLDFTSGFAHFSNIPTQFQGTIHDQPVAGSVRQPATMAMGISSRPIQALNVAFDVVWTDHSVLQSIDLHYPDDATHSLDSSQPKNWHDTLNYHVGAEYSVNNNIQARLGVLIDPSPSPSSTLTPDVPDSSRINLAVGGSYKFDWGGHIDLGYQFLILTGKTSTVPSLPGEYGGIVNIVGLTLGYTSPDYGKHLPPPEEGGAQSAPPGEGGEKPPGEGGAQTAPPDPNLQTPPPEGGARSAPGPDPSAPPPPPPSGGVQPAPPVPPG